ncbi:DUF3081 family protein [Thalassomonas viridans]|uniref:DUF3081 family protein n=1 Tax=Thalassomonas viridans TaxID=137584 RepID=UPI0005CED305|nr:DUF3081 family protein [Thalassomonas viridans]
MHNSIDLKTCLRVFNETVTKGKRCDDYYEYHGFRAWFDFDGYTCFLQYNRVTMTLMFHGKYEIDYPAKEDLAAFEQKLMQFAVQIS